MSESEKDREETIQHWVGMWNDDWKHTITGISEGTGLTRREVMDFMQLVFKKVDREHTGIALEQIMGMLAMLTESPPEEEEPKRFG